MSAPELQLDALEISDGLSVEDMRRIFGMLPKPIDSADRRLEAWAQTCPGASNMIRVDDVAYSWDTRPRRQKNGAVIGRVYAQARGEITRDIGAYKIAAGGAVLWIPAALRGILPGTEGATVSPIDSAQDDE